MLTQGCNVLKWLSPDPFEMHEWALAEAVLATAADIARKEGLTRITQVRVKLGELQQIETDIFRYALSTLRSDAFRNARFVIQREAATLRCRRCDHEWRFQSRELGEDEKESIHFVPEVAHAYVNCTSCGSSDFEVVTGRGVWIESIRGVKPDA